MTSMNRCAWAPESDPAYIAYHDEEWGVPCRDERKLFELLVLEGAQAGLSWRTILHKREGYRRAFADFDAEQIAGFSDAKLAELRTDPGIVRNRLKIAAARGNAVAFLKLNATPSGFVDFIWAFVDGVPKQNRWKSLKDVPAKTPESDRLSAALQGHGFKFVGSTICYAFMQAAGLVNDHTLDCFRHDEVKKLQRCG